MEASASDQQHHQRHAEFEDAIIIINDTDGHTTSKGVRV